jgi:hypothetical protein
MKLFFLFFILLTTSLFGQKKEPKYLSLDVMYGQKILNESSFNGQLNSFNKPEFGGSISYIGIGISTSILVARGKIFDHFGNIYYTQIIPQDIKINDTIKSKITGFNFGFTYFGFDIFPKQKIFNTYVTLGINTGRLRLYQNSLTEEKNPYFSPKIRLQPTLSLGLIRLSLHIEYEYDISKKNWRKTNFSKSDNINLNKTSNSGLNVLASIGYIIKNKSEHKKNNIKVD